MIYLWKEEVLNNKIPMIKWWMRQQLIQVCQKHTQLWTDSVTTIHLLIIHSQLKVYLKINTNRILIEVLLLILKIDQIIVI